jgi:hypothetical protein
VGSASRALVNLASLSCATDPHDENLMCPGLPRSAFTRKLTTTGRRRSTANAPLVFSACCTHLSPGSYSTCTPYIKRRTLNSHLIRSTRSRRGGDSQIVNYRNAGRYTSTNSSLDPSAAAFHPSMTRFPAGDAKARQTPHAVSQSLTSILPVWGEQGDHCGLLVRQNNAVGTTCKSARGALAGSQDGTSSTERES